MSAPLMRCGHAAQAQLDTGELICAACWGITPDAEIAVDLTPDLSERRALCTYFKPFKHKIASIVPSSTDLPFFRYRPDKDTDEYYCGCFGWD